MNIAEIEKRALERRQLRATEIVNEAHLYKVCGQCGSIAPTTTGCCFLCRAYRWDYTREAVIEAAVNCAKIPWPVTMAYVPRV